MARHSEGREFVIIRQATILTMDGEAPFRGDLRVSDGRIAEIAPHIMHQGSAEEVVEAEGCFLLPGLVQPHIHLCQTLFRGAPDDLELLDWLAGRIWPMEAWLDERAMSAAANLGLYELINGGTTTLLDMGSRRHTKTLFERAEASGLRYFGGKCLMDLDRGGQMPADLLEPIDMALGECRELFQEFHGRDADRLRVSIAPRFAVSCSDEMLRAASDYACEEGLVLHSHANENCGEIEIVKQATGRENIDYLSDMGALGSQTVLAHGVHLSDEEVDLLFGSGTHIVHCPSSNMKLGSGFCRVPELLDYGINVALAADGAACNDRLSAFREMALAGLIHKPGREVGAMSAERVLEMATINGARALDMDEEIGSLEVGKRADLILIDPRRPETRGPGDAYSRIVYGCDGEDVRDVMVAGRWLKRDFEVRSLDRDEVSAEADEAWERLQCDFPDAFGGGDD
jgi:5-methylthioadenosine/S-adenosylhomocysteine deaminase